MILLDLVWWLGVCFGIGAFVAKKMSESRGEEKGSEKATERRVKTQLLIVGVGFVLWLLSLKHH